MKDEYSYLHIAKKDLQAAKAMLKAEMYNHSARLCQQYVEKCFKEGIDKKGNNKTYFGLMQTHRVQRLAVVCSEIFDIQFTGKEKSFFRVLTSLYFDTNYPGDDYVEVTREEAEEIFEQTLKFQEDYEHILAGKENGEE